MSAVVAAVCVVVATGLLLVLVGRTTDPSVCVGGVAGCLAVVWGGCRLALKATEEGP